MTAGRVYFIECAGRIKIGFSRNVQARLRQFSTGSALKFSLIGEIDGTKNLEKAIHQKLAANREHGEWFRDCEEVRAILELIQRDGPSAIGFVEPDNRPRTEEAAPYRAPPVRDSVLRSACIRIEACAERYMGEGVSSDRVNPRTGGHYSARRASVAMGMIHDVMERIEALIDGLPTSRAAGIPATVDDIVPSVMTLVERLEIGVQRIFENPDTDVIDVSGYGAAANLNHTSA
jgi:hypothetical protein